MGEGLLESCLDGRLYILNSKAYHEKYGVDDKVKTGCGGLYSIMDELTQFMADF